MQMSLGVSGCNDNKMVRLMEILTLATWIMYQTYLSILSIAGGLCRIVCCFSISTMHFVPNSSSEKERKRIRIVREKVK